jgi:hypothetical protein
MWRTRSGHLDRRQKAEICRRTPEHGTYSRSRKSRAFIGRFAPLQPPTGYDPSNNRQGRRGAGLDFYFLKAMRGESDPEVLLQSLNGTQLASYL